MAPKNNKGKAKEPEKAGAGKVKGGKSSKRSLFHPSINVRHILCEKHAKKEEAVAKLNAGVKFDEVAREFSEDKARQGRLISHIWSKTNVLKYFVTGGSLGWKTRKDLIPEFANVAFELEASTTNNPKWAEVKTTEGFHLVMCEGRK
ncbi:hypothetical protein E4T42_02412 [Aureobasidium subglaciale]|nr:hypothetical protein E4T38_08323 [Aureobasidium subglaciale]KAI5213503.1 hypothetical protein E4T40_09650 [Aureobasidium subglaciale]KAI5215172.1 hypothetical protein E4T41_09688 [Aureobasidium subglaciale]KAI5254238.1 hypothetical protein E4T42_02412 [Aureobasidium subglaciale]KAI5256448.1 hypothetical protein E4T46_08223 [Aureobasidium subglaciale]